MALETRIVELKLDSPNTFINMNPAYKPWKFYIKHSSQDALNFDKGCFAVDSKNA